MRWLQCFLIFIIKTSTATQNFNQTYASFISEKGIRRLIAQLEIDIQGPIGGCTRKKQFQSSGDISNLCLRPIHFAFPPWNLPLLSLPMLCNSSKELFSCWHLPQLMVYDFHVKTARGSDIQNRSLLYLSTASERHLRLLRQLLSETTASVFLLSCNDEPLFPGWLLGHPQVLRVFAAHVPHQQHHPKVVPIPLGIKKQWVVGIRRHQCLALTTKPINLFFAMFSVKSPPLRVKRRSQAVQALQSKGWLKGKEENKRLPPGKFYQQLIRSKFVISPPGNGLDTFRTWESMALGRLPIILSNQLHEDALFADLPTVQVSSWQNLNASFLSGAWDKAKVAVFDANRLTRVWWLAYIVAHCVTTR
eukprot:GGOE01002622.1.p1 GENE.GGOE01002622.1~~GGOE01002622.1.p1  ORF type:complete len:362 (+),score=34.71 GGOE01002622.1:62-1147(+)